MKTQREIITIDPGTNCGWAIRCADGSVHSGTWNLKPDRFQGGGMRYLLFSRFLGKLIDMVDSPEVYYEEVRRHAGTTAAHVYGGLVGEIGRLCELRSIPYAGVPVGTIKKHATGKGNAGKPVMIAAAEKRWSVDCDGDDNRADALCILSWALDQ